MRGDSATQRVQERYAARRSHAIDIFGTIGIDPARTIGHLERHTLEDRVGLVIVDGHDHGVVAWCWSGSTRLDSASLCIIECAADGTAVERGIRILLIAGFGWKLGCWGNACGTGRMARRLDGIPSCLARLANLRYGLSTAIITISCRGSLIIRISGTYWKVLLSRIIAHTARLSEGIGGLHGLSIQAIIRGAACIATGTPGTALYGWPDAQRTSLAAVQRTIGHSEWINGLHRIASAIIPCQGCRQRARFARTIGATVGFDGGRQPLRWCWNARWCTFIILDALTRPDVPARIIDLARCNLVHIVIGPAIDGLVIRLIAPLPGQLRHKCNVVARGGGAWCDGFCLNLILEQVVIMPYACLQASPGSSGIVVIVGIHILDTRIWIGPAPWPQLPSILEHLLGTQQDNLTRDKCPGDRSITRGRGV